MCLMPCGAVVAGGWVGVIGVWQGLGEESPKSQARELGTGRHGRIIFEKQQWPGAWSKQTLEPARQV